MFVAEVVLEKKSKVKKNRAHFQYYLLTCILWIYMYAKNRNDTGDVELYKSCLNLLLLTLVTESEKKICKAMKNEKLLLC